MIFRVLLLNLLLYNLTFSMQFEKKLDKSLSFNNDEIKDKLSDKDRINILKMIYSKSNYKENYKKNQDKLKNLIKSYNFGLDFILFSIVKTEKFLELLDDLFIKVDINAKDESGNTAFLWAVKLNKLSSVNRLLNYKELDINALDNYKKTALFYAFFIKNKEIINTLLKKKDININILDTQGLSILDYAIKNKNIEFAKILLNRDDLKIVTDTCFLNACNKGLIELIEILINKKDINLKDESGKTGLILSVKAGHENLVKFLLENGADASIIDNSGKTALIYAENKENILKLLQENSNIETKNNRDFKNIEKNSINSKIIVIGTSTVFIVITIYIFHKIKDNKKEPDSKKNNKKLDINSCYL